LKFQWVSFWFWAFSALAGLALKLGEVDILGNSRYYILKAEFDNISGLTHWAPAFTG